jgi:hypothetical protein
VGLAAVVKDATRKSPAVVPDGLVNVTLVVAVACAVDDEDPYSTVVGGGGASTVTVLLAVSDPPELVTLSDTV